MNIEDLKGLLDGFDPAALLPELDSLLGALTVVIRFAVLVGPVVLLVLGLGYLFAAPREANYWFGYRCFFGMGSVEAWRYTQRIAGLVWTVLGLILTGVMIFVSSGYAEKALLDVLSSAVTCMLWQAGLIAVSCLAINTVVAVYFDADGEMRRRR